MISYLILIVISIFILSIVSAAILYKKSFIDVIKIYIRGCLISIIKLLIKLYDPVSNVIRPSIRPPIHNHFNLGFKVSNFLVLVKSLFPNSKVTVEFFDNKPLVQGGYQFGYQDINEPLLVKLKQKYNLQYLLDPTYNDFQQLVTIANWVHSQWVHGTSGRPYFNPSNFEADTILTRARLGDRFWCHVYSMTFIQVVASLGYQARLVALTKDGYESSDMHAVTEVWSNHYAKWIALDIDFNIWYLKNDEPMSVLDIHNALIANEIYQLACMKGIKRPSSDFEDRIPDLYSYYKYFFVDMRNDWITNKYFNGHPSRSDQNTLFWLDDRLSPVLTFKNKISNVRDLYWDLNKSTLYFGKTSTAGTLGMDVHIDTLTPNFLSFEVIFNDARVERIYSSTFFWPLKLGANKLVLYSVNSAQIHGIKTEIILNIESE